MRRHTNFLVPVLFLFVFSAAMIGQEPESVEGGHFEWKGEKYTLSAADIERHLKIVQPLNPKIPYAKQLHLAWSRAIRLTCAQVEKIEFKEDEFQKWMRKRHLSLRTSLMEYSDQAAALDSWIKQRGFKDLASYEKACREEFLGEKFESREFPEVKSEEAAIRKQFDEMFTAFEVSVMVFAPETLDDYTPLDIENETHRKLFLSWWESLTDEAKTLLDDQDHPAIEAEVLYFRFADKSVDELKEFFERDRPEIGGSFQELTKDYEFDTTALLKMASRWQQQRRGTMAHWNASLAADLTNEKSFELIQPHLERVWRLIRYLGDIWNEIDDAKEPVDLKAIARAKGVSYRHIPMTPTRLLYGDKILPGDHPLYIARRSRTGLYSYSNTEDSSSSIYYANGLVDQPGIHASIWSVLGHEAMQVRKPDEVLASAWPTFERANKWRIAFDRAKHVRSELDKLVKEHLAELEKEGPLSPEEKAAAEIAFVKEHFGPFFDQKKPLLKLCKILPSLFIRPEDGRLSKADTRGQLGMRVENYLKMGWDKIVGMPTSSLAAGQIIPMAFSHERRLCVLTRINKIHPPSDHRWNIDAAGREAARIHLEQGDLFRRADNIRRSYAFPNIVHRFKISAPQYERLMTESLLGGLKPAKDTKNEGK